MDGIKILKIKAISLFIIMVFLSGYSCIDDNPTDPDYVDDDSNLARGAWTIASPPSGKQVAAINKMLWYNPYDPVSITDIWPDSTVDVSENKQTVLYLDYSLFDILYLDSASWCGIMRTTFELESTIDYEYLNLWLKVDTLIGVSDVVFNIDIGVISEDINYNGRLETEDRNLNGVFESNEDTGLDTLTDAQEMAVILDPVYPDDPSGDNWEWSDSYTYTYINGTEGNRNDSQRENLPDTEDINGDGSLNLDNAYFEYRIDPFNSTYVQTVTSTGWINIRIPIYEQSAYQVIGNASFDNLNCLRIWLPVDENRVKIMIAVLDLE